MQQYFRVSYCKVFLCSKYILQFICFTVDGHLSFFKFLVIMDNGVYEHSSTGLSVHMRVHFSCLYVPERHCWVIGYKYLQLQQKLANCFPLRLHQFTFLPAESASSHGSTFLSALAVVRLFTFHYSGEHVMASSWSFSLHFHRD